MILLNDWVKKFTHILITGWTSSIDSNSRVGVFAARENCLLKSEPKPVSLVLAGLPKLWSQELGEKRALLAIWEGGEALKIIRRFKMRSN